MSDVMWQPGARRIERARVTAFREEVNRRHGLALARHSDLYEWSIRDRERFWESVWRFCGVRASHPWERVLVDGDRMPGARWFVGARLNYAQNLLRRRDDTEAIVAWREDGSARRLTFAELYRLTARLADSLRRAGVRPGDRIAGFLPNIPEAVIAMLAAASLGAVWSSCSPDFGVAGILDRFGQIAPKVLFAADGTLYQGKTHASLDKIREIVAHLPALERLVVIPYFGERLDLASLPRAVLFDDFLAPETVAEIEFASLPFDHPLAILFSSGTTGMPKCMVHSSGGTLLQHLKEHVLHCDLRPGHRIFYFTTCGWMMWNWLVSALASESTIVLYDGSPLHPHRDALWDLAERERLTVFGTSAKYLASQHKAGAHPARSHDLAPLESILSTGSPLAPEIFDYVYRDVKPDVRLSSISGGTDIVSCFALGSPVLPVVRGELQCRGLGMKVEVFDDDGNPVIGETGELVCTAPFPSMPTGFWNDPDGRRFHSAYFDRWANVWAHGDWAEIRPSGGMVIHGRSDAVLNPGGVRIGTAEIYRIVERFDEILESLAAGQEWKGDTRVVLFVRLREGHRLDEALRRRIRDSIRSEASPRHVPSKIVAVSAIPRTLSGKIVEIAVRDVIHGRTVRNLDALANPEALDLYRDLAELRED